MSKNTDSTHLFSEWLRAIDELNVLLSELKRSSDKHVLALNLKSLSFNTYLCHIDRLLIEIREQLMNYQYRVNEFDKDAEALSDVPFLLAKKTAQQCYITILEITQCLKVNDAKTLHNHRGFIKKLHGLELDASELTSAVRGLTSYSIQKETLEQLAFLEKSLMENLQKGALSTSPVMPYKEHLGIEDFLGQKSSTLKSHCGNILNDSNRELLVSLIDIYDNLKRCYVVARKSTINITLEHMYESLDDLGIMLAKDQFEQQEFNNCLGKYYNALVSLRFSTNRDSRCSKNLYEKARCAKQQMRRICIQYAICHPFLETITLRKIDRLKMRAKM